MTTEERSITTDVPDIAIRWILQYSCTSNYNLAALSNVNQHWRSVVSSVLKDFINAADNAKAKADTYKAMEISTNAIDDDNVNYKHVSRSIPISIPKEYHHLSNLLLPEMTLEILRRCQGNVESSSNSNDNGNMPMKLQSSSPSFCLAWFPPTGIKAQPVNLNTFSDEELFSSDSGSSEEDENDEINFLRQRLYHQKKIANKEDVIENCCIEWTGYRNAIDILLPLDYSPDFVESILEMAIEVSCRDKDPTIIQSNNQRDTTIAVRGAVFARPQKFCLCWDADQAGSKITTQLDHLNSDEKKSNQCYKVMDLKRRKKKHDKMRRTRMREVLPRLITSTTVKNPLLQDPLLGILDGKRQPCLQFLNADKSRAVYLRTPPFDCGPVQGPITMFCVGIATEDGCLVSGLNTRFELGHLHGIDAMDKEIDMSPICICAENKVSKLEDDEDDRPFCRTIKSYSEDMSDSSGDDYQIKRKGSILCQCQIQYNQNKDDSSYEGESECAEPNQKNIYRGQMGPGRWHCYTAVFNRSESIIRVDGCTEKINNALSPNSNDTADPTLDGLTIGSDHCFEMPLCFGEGSDGEGEGSIAELAVFKGLMSIQDIEYYEKHLMKKHGIVHGQQQIFPQEENRLRVKKVGNQWQEDLWRRQVHALISHPPPYEISEASIPLRVAAAHRSVAWNRSNDVTGKKIRVSRIGSRQSNGSSDW